MSNADRDRYFSAAACWPFAAWGTWSIPFGRVTIIGFIAIMIVTVLNIAAIYLGSIHQGQP